MEKDLLPQPPWAGPPLPRILGQKWPWVSQTEPDNSDPPEYQKLPEIPEIMTLHKEGMPAIEIAARLNVTPDLVRYRLRRASYEPIVAPKFLKAAERSADIVRLHQQGLTPKEIAERLGISLWPVYRRLQDAELMPRPRPEETEAAVKRLDEMVRLAQEDRPRFEIAKRTGSTWPLVAEALEASSVRPVIPACEEIASWASTLLPTIDEITRAAPDTEPILRKLDQLEKELAAIADATWTAAERLPWKGKEADKERWCLGDIKHSASESLDVLDALKGCIKQLDVERLPKRLEQARTCIENTTNTISGHVRKAAQVD